MRFIKLYGIDRRPHASVEVLLCDVVKDGRRAFRTGVRADWEPPTGGFTREDGPLYDIDLSESGTSGDVFNYSTDPDITALRGEKIQNRDRLRLLLGETISLGDYTIKPAK